MTTPHSLDDADPTDDDETPDPREHWRFHSSDEWFTDWFRHAMAGSFDDSQRWCAQWWKHTPIVLRFEELWTAWEAARLSDDPAAMSGWRVHHADPQWRTLTAENGPLHLCTARKHTDTRGLPAMPPPPGWTDTP